MPPLSGPAVVTTSRSAPTSAVERARHVAEACGLPFVARAHLEAGVAALVVESTGAHLILPDRVVRSHPGMGLVRVRRLVKGNEKDPVVEAAQLRPGDSVLDPTFGFGQDATVMAHVIGSTGRLVGIEINPLLAALSMAGGPLWPAPAGAAIARSELRCEDGRAYLRRAASSSFDVVFLDPMFQRPRPAAPDFAALRLLADDTPLSPEDIAEARRVARRWVVIKDAWPGKELDRLKVPALPFRRSAEVVLGRIAGSSEPAI
jgi:hypothetical protein